MCLQSNQRNMNSITNHKPARIAWLCDLHLDQTSPESELRFLKRLSGVNFDVAIVTGDTSNGREIAGHLAKLGAACGSRPVFFCCGNHDFHGSDFDSVHAKVREVCKRHDNLNFLGHGEIVPLTENTALVGHGGWADGRAGWGRHTIIKSPDQHRIGDLARLSSDELFNRMHQLGRESAGYFRNVIPRALRHFSHLIVCTHAPPFRQATRFNGKICSDAHLPHFSNISVGGVIAGIAKHYPRRRITVVCGHTHCPAQLRILKNLEVRVGGAQRGAPAIQVLLEIN
jgi:UDP-2,3-diacylglucosamine pyrophosphatase LpxH